MARENDHCRGKLRQYVKHSLLHIIEEQGDAMRVAMRVALRVADAQASSQQKWR